MLSLPIHSVVERDLQLAGYLMGGHREALEVMEYIRSGQIMPRITERSIRAQCPNKLLFSRLLVGMGGGD